MAEWVISGKPSTYDAISAFRNLKIIDWRQILSDVAINDIVYIYMSGNINQIKLKCIVTKINLPKPEIDDIKYFVTPPSKEYKKYMQLKLLEEYDDPRLGYHELKQRGLNSVQGQQRLPESVKKYIESVTTKTTFELKNEGTSTRSGTDNVNQSIINDKNIILYGPPGTGKTYNSVIYAVAICDNIPVEDVKLRNYEDVLDRYRELKNDGRDLRRG